MALPWVPGTHNVAGTSGMCGAVRGVSAAGRCTSCFCLLFKCFTLKLTPTQINHLITHTDSPYIRVVGFNADKQVQMASFIVHKPE